MGHHCRRWFTALVTSLCLGATAAWGAGGPDTPVDNSEHFPLLPSAFALGSFLLVLWIVCKPNRKR